MTGTKRRKICSGYKPRENMSRVQSAGKYVTGRERGKSATDFTLLLLVQTQQVLMNKKGFSAGLFSYKVHQKSSADTEIQHFLTVMREPP